MRGGMLAAVAITLSLVGGAGAAPTRTTALQHVTLIGDSVADGIANDSSATTVLGGGIALDLEVAPCRRVDGQSCPYQGTQPPTVIQLVSSLGAKLGPNVVIAVGYNDFEAQYADNIESALAALNAAGVKRVWWLTLRAVHHGYLTMNDAIEAAAEKHPELTVIDWNVYSRSHPDWFQPDGLHLLPAGAMAMATLVHKTLVSDGIAVPPIRINTSTLPSARRGHAYRARLRAAAGIAPYRWSLLERAPAGIHLESNGLVEGVPRVKPGRYTFNVRVKDSSGYVITRRLTLPVTA